MSRDASVSFDWADDHHCFRLPLGQLREVQDKTGVGPMTLLRRLQAGGWMVDDPREVLRCGLIGAGMEPVQALDLVRRYVDERPLGEAVRPAYLVLAAALFGPPDEALPGKQKAAGKTTGSASPPSTAPEPSSDGPRDRSTT